MRSGRGPAAAALLFGLALLLGAALGAPRQEPPATPWRPPVLITRTPAPATATPGWWAAFPSPPPFATPTAEDGR